MKYPGRLSRILVSASVCFVLAGCFSYEKHETVVPAVETPATTTSTTTTSTVPDTSTTVEKQHTTTYTNTSP
jgi:ABC-type uncharacterized transport system auxiliary subunit